MRNGIAPCAKGPNGTPCGRATKTPRLTPGDCPRCWINGNFGGEPKGLGDRIAGVLSAVGITPERVSKVLGKPCGCKERKEKLNRFGRQVAQIFNGSPATPDTP